MIAPFSYVYMYIMRAERSLNFMNERIDVVG